MNGSSSSEPDPAEPLSCPKCGAPSGLPDDLNALMVHCAYCEEDYPLPRQYRELRERRRLDLRGPAERTSTLVPLAIVGVLVVLGAMAAGFATLVPQRPPPVASVEVDDPPSTLPAVSAVVSASAVSNVDDELSSGESIVRERLVEHEKIGCTNVLLPPTHIVGERDIDAKFVAGGPCVRFVAATGSAGEPLVLTMRAPGGRIAASPAPAQEIDFLYCPTVAGAHPATIRGADGDTFTVSSVECPRRKATK